MAPPWSCECCCEDFSDYTKIDMDGSPVCVLCVRQMFDKALKFEHHYPPKWSGPLHPSEFSHVLSAEYIAKYRDKEIEYNTPPTKRVYCQYDVERWRVCDGKPEPFFETCGAFIGARRKRIKDGILVFGRCRGLDCGNVTCMVCEYYNHDPDDMLQHICLGKFPAHEKRAQAFLGLKRGKDWQQCPSRTCERRIELSEACNHIDCQCGTGFCFICGKEADGDSEHWRKGGCPRYNQPGDANVEYDDDYDDGENDDRASSTNEHVDGDSEADFLENIRSLFEVEEYSGVSSAPPANVMSEDMERRLAAAVTRVRRPPFTAEMLVERLRFAGYSPALAEESLVLAEESLMVDQLAGPKPAEAGEEPEMPELIAIDPNDAEAIANAFLEDDLNHDGHYHAPLFNSLPGSPIVTTEEADVDQALWRMAVE